MLDRAMELLSQARSSLVEAQSVAELVESGHAARVRYDNFSRPQILATTIETGLARRAGRPGPRGWG